MYAINDESTLRQCLSERDQLRRYVDSVTALISTIDATPDLADDVDLAPAEDLRDNLVAALREREKALDEYERPRFVSYEDSVARGWRAA